MADAGDASSHKRSRSSAARSLLRRKDPSPNPSTIPDDEGTASDNDLARATSAASSMSNIQPTISATSNIVSTQQNSRSQNGRLSISNMPHRQSITDRSISIEQSVRKFRLVEVLRTGDTTAILKAIRESHPTDAPPQASTVSLGGGATALEDTTILHLAIQCVELPIVEFVLSNASSGGFDVNTRDRDGNTPLHIAAQLGRTPVVKLLLETEGVNDATQNNQGKLPIDVTRNADIFQLLQLSRSLFTDAKVKQVQGLVARGDYDTLKDVLEEPRLKTLLDVNSPEFVSDPVTADTGGSLLHEAARKKNTSLIQVLLLHGADPFRRDVKGKLPQDVTKDDATRAMLKKSPAAVAAQRGIEEKAVLGHTVAQGTGAAGNTDPLAGKEAREMSGYLKKWTNYRKGYQLRWFVLENGFLSYYKHQDETKSVCRGVINMRIAKLHMSPDEKTKFEITGKSSVKYTLKANHEIEAKRWFWALNNSIQWSKDQEKEEDRQRARSAELLRQAKAEQQGSSSKSTDGLVSATAAADQFVGGGGGGGGGVGSENASVTDRHRSSVQISRTLPGSRVSIARPVVDLPAGTSTVESNDDDDLSRFAGGSGHPGVSGEDYDDDEDDDHYGEDATQRAADTKDALNITAQSAKLQLDFIGQVNAALNAELSRNPNLTLADPKVAQALSTYDAATRTIKGLIGDILKISKDRDVYWQYRLSQETQMRRMWEESMAKVAMEQEELQARVGQAEMKRKIAKRALREVIEAGGGTASPTTLHSATAHSSQAVPAITTSEYGTQQSETSQDLAASGISRRTTAAMDKLAILSDDESETDDEEFFDAVDAGEVKVSAMPTIEAAAHSGDKAMVSSGLDISSSFKGYENGIRTRLKIDADNRPKISLWGILKSMIGKDMTKMTLPVTFNEPTSLLYRCGEDMEYAELLDLAVERSDSIERLMYVAAFAASEYASTLGRVAKPFNPLLGETFEYVRPDKNYRFFIEQVSHHPPVGAAWAESPRWTYWGESAVQSTFKGTTFDVRPVGYWFLKLRPADGSPEELYMWEKVDSSVYGIMTGNPSVYNHGPMTITNYSTGEVCSMEFKPKGWTAASAYQIAGKIVDANKHVRFSLGGRWNSRIYARRTPGFQADVGEGDAGGNINDPDRAFLLWEANARPTGIPFNLTPFVLTFNHLDDKLQPWLAPTDSRFRPDQRAMEEGEYDFAATEKERLEDAQRARRRARERKGEEYAPRWFSKTVCEVTGKAYWKFNEQYWVQREKAGSGDGTAWEGLEPIYESSQ